MPTLDALPCAAQNIRLVRKRRVQACIWASTVQAPSAIGIKFYTWNAMTQDKEIRIRDTSGIFRVMYVAKLEEAVYVLHCFQKKTQMTSKRDKDIAAARYRAVAQARQSKS